jgi:hypothetical protein
VEEVEKGREGEGLVGEGGVDLLGPGAPSIDRRRLGLGGVEGAEDVSEEVEVRLEDD